MSGTRDQLVDQLANRQQQVLDANLTCQETVNNVVHTIAKALNNKQLSDDVTNSNKAPENPEQSSCVEATETAAQAILSALNSKDSSNTSDGRVIPGMSNELLTTLCHKLVDLLHELKVYREQMIMISNDLGDLYWRMNNSDQYSYNYNLMLHKLKNVPISTKEHRVSHEEFNLFIANELNKFFPNLAIKPNDIDIAHPIKSRKGNKADPVVVVRFYRRSLRHDIYANKKLLKGKSLVITEHLTQENLYLLRRTKEIYGKNNAWSNSGVIYASINGIKTRIRSHHDLPMTITRNEPPQADGSNYTSNTVTSPVYEPVTPQQAPNSHTSHTNNSSVILNDQEYPSLPVNSYDASTVNDSEKNNTIHYGKYTKGEFSGTGRRGNYVHRSNHSRRGRGKAK